MEQTKLRSQSLGMLSMLAIQFVLGMVLNLFTNLPNNHPGISGNYFDRAVHSFGWAITVGGGVALLLHVLVAIGLLVSALTMLARAVFVKSWPWIAVGIVGLAGVIVALTDGLAFLGYNSDVYSFVMAMGFIGAAIAYSTALMLSEVPLKNAHKVNRARPTARLSGHRYHHSHS